MARRQADAGGDIWSDAEARELAGAGGSPTPYPGHWNYTWLGGQVEPIVAPLSRHDVEDAEGHIDPAKWEAALAEMAARPKQPLFPSPLHVHVPACYAGRTEYISLKQQPPDHVGVVDALTGHWITTRLATAAESRDTRQGLPVDGPGPGPAALPVYR